MLKKRLESLGHWFFYITLRVFGHRGGVILLGPVITFYVLFSRKIHHTVRPYLKHKFPGRSRLKYWLYAWRNVYAFGHVLVDRAWLGLNPDAQLACDLVGYSKLEELIAEGKGVVLLTAHVGNWQSALAALDAMPVTVHALMEYDSEAAAKHYFDLERGKRGFQIIDAKGPFGGMVDAAAALGRGEIVTIMGDRYIRGSSSTVDFLGEPVRLPDLAYVLAAATGAAVAVLLAAKTGSQSYQLKLWDSFSPGYEHRDKRDKMLRLCTEKYVRAMEKYLTSHPYQWYNFYNFWKQ